MMDPNDLNVEELGKNIASLKDNLEGLLNKVCTPDILSKMTEDEKTLVDKAKKTFDFGVDNKDFASNLEEVIKIIRR